MKGIQLFQPDNRSLQIAVQSKEQRVMQRNKICLSKLKKRLSTKLISNIQKHTCHLSIFGKPAQRVTIWKKDHVKRRNLTKNIGENLLN